MLLLQIWLKEKNGQEDMDIIKTKKGGLFNG